ncbi:MAG: hypothetical protein IJV99_04095, partial [Clostridia bacterium]|nr:hypothetical protein [Clostridia bacterium]
MKNRFLVKFLSLALSVITALSCFALVGCSKESKSSSDPNHYRKVVETQEWLVKEAKTDYSILISADADDNIVTASRELQTLFKEATGITLNILTDDAVTYSKDGKFLSIGKNKASNAVGLVADKSKIKAQGFYIKTVDNSIFMIGGTSLGSLYSVYEFLSIQFGFEHYFTDVYYIDKNVTDISFNLYDVREITDIDVMTVTSLG